MILDHVALWTANIERLKDFYVKYFEGTAGEKYTNSKKQFESYFLSFKSGTKLEIMQMPEIPDNPNSGQHTGLIHLAFAADSMKEVDEKAKQLESDGFMIRNGPRVTGDGYYELESQDPDGNIFEVAVKVYTF